MMADFNEIAVQGLTLPFRLYFQPQRTLVRAVEMPNALTPFLIYLCSLIWVAITAAIGLIVFGVPASNQVSFILLVSISLAILGMIGGRGRVQNLQGGRAIFNYNLAAVFGLYLNNMLVLNVLMLEQMSRETGYDVGVIVDSGMLTYPMTFLIEAAIGLSFSVFAYSYINQRLGLIGAFILCGLVVVATFAGSNMAVRTGNIPAFLTASLIATHLIFQPIYLLIGVISALIIELNPQASAILWTISPAHWCEIAYVPLPGLKKLLLGLHKYNPTDGLKAIQEISAHPFYSGVGTQAEAEI